MSEVAIVYGRERIPERLSSVFHMSFSTFDHPDLRALPFGRANFTRIEHEQMAVKNPAYLHYT